MFRLQLINMTNNDNFKHKTQYTWWCVLSSILQLEWISWTWDSALKKFSFKSSSLNAFICKQDAKEVNIKSYIELKKSIEYIKDNNQT